MHRPDVHHRARLGAGLATALALLFALPPAAPSAGADAGPAPVATPEPVPTPERAEESSPPTPEFSEVVSVSWVLVPVVVHTRNGYAQGLERRNFRLWVDDRRVPIDELDLGSDAPLSVVWLQDLSGSMANAGKLETSRRAFERFLAGARPGDEIALASFAGGSVAVEVPFTDDLTPLRESAATWEGYGTTALHDAVSLLPELSAESSRGKRVAILVTDGQDNASRLSSGRAVELVRRARLPVYVLGLRSPGVPAPQTSDSEEDDPGKTLRYGEILRGVAERTGGRYTDVTADVPPATGSPRAALPEDDTLQVDAAVAAILDDLRLRYILAITTAGDGPKTYHRLRVEAVLPGGPGGRARGDRPTSLTYRRGYHGTEPLALRDDAGGERNGR